MQSPVVEKNQKDKFKKFMKSTGRILKYGGYRANSILNGIVGNHIAGRAESLAIPMQFRKSGSALDIQKGSLKKKYAKTSSHICILVPGLLDDEHVWSYNKDEKKDYGSLLEKDIKCTSFYVRYNSGLHVSENGRLLSDLISKLVKNFPVKIKKITIIAHSMGGLVSRSSSQHASRTKERWVKSLTDLITIGTPHLGSPMEKLGNIATSTLLALPFFSTRTIGKIANLRSNGIKDLRFGYTEDTEWNEKNDDAWLASNKASTRILKNVRYYAISGSITKDPKHPLSFVLGDSLVRAPSATGDSMIEDHSLNIPADQLKEFPGFSHLKLAHHPAVYKQIRKWLRIAK